MMINNNHNHFTIIQNLISTIELSIVSIQSIQNKSKNFYHKIIFYPPLEFIEEKLMNLSEQEKNDLYNFFFSGKVSLKLKPTTLKPFNFLGILLTTIVVIFPSKAYTNAKITPFASAEFGHVYPTRYDSAEFGHMYPTRSNVSVSTKATSDLKHKSSIINTTSRNQQISQGSKIITYKVPNTNHEFRTMVGPEEQVIVDATGIVDQYEKVRSTNRSIKALIMKGEILNSGKDVEFLSLEADHFLPETMREDCGLDKEHSIAINVPAKMNSPRTNTNDASLVLSRRESYQDFITNKTSIYEFHRRKISESFEVVFTDFYGNPNEYLADSQNCLRKNLSLGLQMHEEQLKYGLITPYGLPPGYDIMAVEGNGMIRSMAKDANRIKRLANNPESNLETVINYLFLEDLTERLLHINDLKLVLKSNIALSTAAVEWIERNQENAFTSVIDAVTQLEQLKSSTMTSDQKKQSSDFKQKLITSKNISTKSPTLASLDQKAKEVGMHQPYGDRGKFLTGRDATRNLRKNKSPGKSATRKGIRVVKKVVSIKGQKKIASSKAQNIPQTNSKTDLQIGNGDDKFLD